MQIKRLRIAGFKSFVEPADLVIAPGLTGVVGPNGCGKSNLLEALRWTMGENSAKSLRGAGMDDVIFAGTATRPPRAFAEVSILAEVDGQETEVVRRIERGAGSAYRIDGQDVRARDVGLLFADAATGAHSPALVSQGRISAVIAAKPAERRAMLEEAAGISGLHVRRRDAENRLRATEANLARLDEVIVEQDTRAAALRRQARAAERYRLLSDRIRVAEARMIFSRWQEAATAADAAKRDAAAADAAVAAATVAERDRTRALLDATAALASVRSAALAARDRAGAAGHALDTLRARRASAAARIADLTAAAARIVAERAQEGTLAAQAVDALGRLAAEAKAIDARLADTITAIPSADAALAGTERSARDAEVALAQALTAQASEAAETRVATAALAAAHARHDRATRDAAQVATALASLATPAPMEATRAQATADRDAANHDAAVARATLASAERAERDGRVDLDAAETARAAARADLAAIDSDIAALTRATQTGGRARLLDDVSVAPGFERALAAALGDDLETAPGAWTGADVRPGDPGAPGDADALAIHAKAPSTLTRRLRQCFVVERDDGRPLGVGQRLVTRDGDLRRWDGFASTDTGVAAAQRLERVNRLRRLTDGRPAAAAALAKANDARSLSDTAIAAARRTAADARIALVRADQTIRTATQTEDRALAQIERLSDQRADLDARAARIAGDVAEATAERDRAIATRAALPDGAAAAARVGALAHDADRARSAVTRARDARTALDRAAATDRERMAAVTAETRSWRARAGDAARRIADMDARAANIARDTAAIADRPVALDAEIAVTHAAHAVARTAAETLAAGEIAADAAAKAATLARTEAAEALAAARETRAGAAARHENQELRRVEMGRLSGERFECPAPVLPERLGFVAATIASPQDESAVHERLMLDRERIGAVNLIAERELAELEAVAAANTAERVELGHAVNRLRGSIGTLNREGRQRLLAAFEAVDGHFRTLFTTLFDGGQAHLALIDSDDPLEAGLEIMVQPPGKRLQSLTLLSGGEQALTAVALIFGLFLTNPAPICVLDEVDAPLDDANIERFCDLLDRMARDTATRYLVVTHNAVTMSRMHRLFGVTMIERGVSRLVSVDLQAAEGLLAE